MNKFLALLVALALMTGCIAFATPCPACPTCAPTICPPEAQPTPTPAGTETPSIPPPPPQRILWDARLDELNVKVTLNPTARYKLAAVWLTENGSWDGVPSWAWAYVDKVTGGGGDRHMFGGVYDAGGRPIMGKTVVMYWGSEAQGYTTDAAGWMNGVCQAVYHPDLGESGPYSIAPLNGDRLVGGGLPNGRHFSIFGIWVEK